MKLWNHRRSLVQPAIGDFLFEFSTFMKGGQEMEETIDASKEDGAASVSFIFSAVDTLQIRFAGTWNIAHGLSSTDEAIRQIKSRSTIRHIRFDAEKLAAWDTSLLTYLIELIDFCDRNDITVTEAGLPGGVIRLLSLASAVPEKRDARSHLDRKPFLARIGEEVLQFSRSTLDMISFIGEASVAFYRLINGKARFRRSDLKLHIQECGAMALPIVSLISILVGLILAFVGAVQLRLFGAQIYVADLVGLGMAREMGAMMTAIIMAGRTGAAFAAQLGTMQVNEEIDALRTMGISPMEFLVLPRMLALVLMLPLLCVYANLMGILGGGIIGVSLLDISPMAYFQETRAALHLRDFMTGIIKAGVFGVLVALSGCLRGMQCGRSASAVGDAATSAVVTAIVSIIISDSALTVIYDVLGV
jgi:phospholipid/cholesterol/gamma-HCH transport system permease protein